MKLRFRLVMAILMVAAVALAGVAEAAAPARNETVYVALSNDGHVREMRLGAWVHGPASGDSWTDYGRYADVTNSTSAETPTATADGLIWPATALRDAGLFYQATLDQALPVDVSIGYRLDGKEISADELAGKSGSLEMTVHVVNRLSRDEIMHYTGYDGRVRTVTQRLCTPLMFQLSLSVPVRQWSGIDAPGATQVLVGDNLQLSWAVFPMPDADIVLKMSSARIELDPANMVIVPMAPPVPAVTGDAELRQLISGLDQLEQGLNSADAAGGLTATVGQLTTGLDSLAKGVANAAQGAGALGSGISQLQAGHQQLANQLDALTDSGDPRLQAIAGQIRAEQQALDQLAAAAAALASGLTTTRDGAQQIASQAGLLASSFTQSATGTASSMSRLVAGIDAMKQAAIKQYDAVKIGQATVGRLTELAGDYRSFADSRNSATRTQFLLRTDGIKAAPAVTPEEQPAKEQLSWWQRIVNFLRGRQ